MGAASPPYIEDRLGIATPVVSLTYDDGPSPWTEPILDRLSTAGQAGTFFVIGAAITDATAETLQRIVGCGSEIGIHSWSHPKLTSLPDDWIRDQIERTRERIVEVTGVEPRCWRPPYLLADERVREAVADMRLIEVSGSITAKDWEPDITTEQVVRTVTGTGELLPGAVVVMHDGRSPADHAGTAPTREATVEATAAIVDELLRRGLRSVTVSDLAAAV